MTEPLASVRDEEEFAEESEDIIPGSSKDIVTCPWCGKVFMDGTSLRTHCYNIHGAASSKKERSGRLLCPESDCGCMLVSYDALCKHCEEKHDFVPDDTKEEFDSVDEFKFWLAQLSITSGHMVKRRGERKTAEGLSMGDFHCCFDGKKRETPSIRAPDRNPYNRRVPSRKLGFSCPAHIRYTVNIDGSVVIKAQTKHFGHEAKPTSSNQYVDGTARRKKERKGTYAFDTLNYDEMSPLHTNHLIEEDGIEMDDHGMVNLSSVSSLERASFFALSSCSRLEMALTEVQSIPHENLSRVNLLIDKLHELSATASTVENLLKDLAVAPDSPIQSPTIDLKQQKVPKSSVRSIRKRPQSTEIKEEVVDNGKRSRLTANGSHDEERFERHCESGEMTEHEGELGEEIVVDDEDVEDDREMKK